MAEHMRPYEGSEPYIFISYSHKDTATVQPLLEALSRAGYRFWYDAGIHAGSKWTKVLAERIEHCTIFMPLHSKSSIESDFCYRETHFASSKHREIVPLYLENIELPGEWGFLLIGIQHLKLFHYVSVDAFAESLSQHPVFAPCKDEPPPDVTSQKTQTNIAPQGVPLEWNKDGGILWALRDGVLTIKPGTSTKMPDYDWAGATKGTTSPWYNRRDDIQSIVIDQGITFVGNYAFSRCRSLTSVTIPNSVTEIGDSAFLDCTSLTSVTIPDSVTEIGYSAFLGCTSLTSVTIPDIVTKIGGSAFWGCTSLTSVTIPVTEIGSAAFLGCTSLTSVTIPDSVTVIGEGAFFLCTSLTSVSFPDSVTVIGDSAFLGCTSLTSVSVSRKTRIVGSAFPSHTKKIYRD